MQRWMRFPWMQWIQRLFGRWRGPAARASQPPVTTSPPPHRAGETSPAPIVSLPSDGLPWQWGWLFGNGKTVQSEIADTPSPSATDSPGADAGQPEKSNPAATNTEALDAVFTNYASSSEKAVTGEEPSAAGPSQIEDFLSPPSAGGRQWG